MNEIFADLHVHIGRSEQGKPIKITAARSLNFANIAKEYATKRYRSNVMNWGMVPFLMDEEPQFEVDDYIYVPGIRAALDGTMEHIPAYVISGDVVKVIDLRIAEMTNEEKAIVKAGCLINYNRNRKGL